MLDTDPDRLCVVLFLGCGVGGSGLFGAGGVLVEGIVSCGLVEDGLKGSLVGRGGGGNAMLRPTIFRLSISKIPSRVLSTTQLVVFQSTTQLLVTKASVVVPLSLSSSR